MNTHSRWADSSFRQAQARSRSALRLQNAVAPYARFVQAEESRWTDILLTLEVLGAHISALLPRNS